MSKMAFIDWYIYRRFINLLFKVTLSIGSYILRVKYALPGLVENAYNWVVGTYFMMHTCIYKIY